MKRDGLGDVEVEGTQEILGGVTAPGCGTTSAILLPNRTGVQGLDCVLVHCRRGDDEAEEEHEETDDGDAASDEWGSGDGSDQMTQAPVV